MNRIKKQWIGLICLLLISLMAVPAAAETAVQKLFDLSIKDGYKSWTIPVSEVTDEKGVHYELGNKLTGLTVNAASAGLTVKIRNKTSYYKNKYKSVTYTKKPTLTAGKKKTLKYKLKLKTGGTKTVKLAVTRPAKPAITGMESTSTILYKGNGSLKFVFNVKTVLPVLCTVKIRSSANKVVYSHTVGQGTNPSWTVWWDGRSGSDTATAAGDYVPAGTYKMTLYLRYRYGNKNKYVKKTQNIAVKDKVDTSGSSWPWTVIATGNPTLDYLAELACREALTGKENEVKRAKKLFTWCAAHFTRLSNRNFKASSKDLPYKMDITSKNAKAQIKAYGKVIDAMVASGEAVINNSDAVYPNCGTSSSEVRIDCATNALSKQVGDCLNMAWMYEIVCRHAGLQCDIIENNIPKNDTKIAHHFWNVVQVNGKWYECDVRDANAMGDPKNYSKCLRGKNYMENVGNGNDAMHAQRYNNIWQGPGKERYMALYNKISKTDCPGR